MQVHLTLKSANVKTGPIPVSTTEKKSCPPSCPHITSCYAKSGPLALHWSAVSKKERGSSWREFVNQIKQFQPGQLWRHNQAGDLPGLGPKIDKVKIESLVKANASSQAAGFTYTHKPILGRDSVAIDNRKLIKAANKSGFTINLSADNLHDADKMKRLNIGPVVTLLPQSYQNKSLTPGGNTVIVCPAQTRDNVSCSSCKLCARVDREVIIGFLAHGSAKKTAEKIFFMKAA
jgi:hypothetical protein